MKQNHTSEKMNHRINTTRRRFVQAIPAVGAGFLLGENHALGAEDPVQPAFQGVNSWQSPSLRSETVTGPNGVAAAAETFTVNARMGADKKAVSQPAPGGWIIVDSGDSTLTAAEMREMLERAVGKKIKVAAILLTHWHYADGTAAWLDAPPHLRGR
jgi:hypothetical protein